MGSRGRTPRVLLPAVAWALVPAFIFVVACSSNDSAPPAAGDGGAETDGGAIDASAAADADAAAPLTNPDPQDVDPANGDASLDIAGSAIYFDAGQPWVRAIFYGAWPPPATLYAWSCQVFLSTANAPVVTYTVQSLSGTQTTYAEGIDSAKVTFATEPTGFRVRFADGALAFDRYALQCTAQKTRTGESVQDDSGSFTITTKETRSYAP